MNLFTRILAGAMVIICISAVNCSAWYQLLAKNGGANGYNNIVIHVDTWGTSIWCEGSGYEKIPTQAVRSSFGSNTIDKNDQEAANYAMNQMRAGVKSGYLKISGRYVTWKRTPGWIYISVI